jgi:hypothetical protein
MGGLQSLTAMTTGRILYTALRACVFGMGVLILLGLLIGPLLDGGFRTAEEAARGTVAFLAALSYVCPNRWGVRGPVFYLRLAVMLLAVAGVLQMDYRMATGVYGPKRPEMYGSMIPMDIAMIAAPLLLVWRRRSMRAGS